MGMLRFTLNGETRETGAGTRLLDVLESLGMDARRIAVERNREVVRRADQASIVVAEDDVFEVVHFVGGG